MISKLRKRALGVLVPVACATLLAGCDDFLETQPFGSLDTSTFYKTDKDFRAAIIGAYSTLQNLTFSGRDASLFEFSLLPDDDTRAPSSEPNDNFTFTGSTPSGNYIWDVSYRGVLRANLILEQLEKPTQLTELQKQQYAAEAKFVRAYFYFILAKHFGTPPVVTKVASSIAETRPSNSAPGEVWDLIESDLKAAIEGLKLQQNVETGRVTQWAARALLGKAQIYRAQWFKQPQKYQEAINNLQQIVDSGRFRLVPYPHNFLYTTENNAESLFELQASWGTDINGWAAVDENGGGASSGTGRNLATGAGGGPTGIRAPGGFDWGDGGIIVTPGLVNEFESYGTVRLPIPQDPTKTVEVTIRDPRAYWTFFSSGENYGRVCPAAASGKPAPYNFEWKCVGSNLEVGRLDRWSITGHTPAKYLRPFENFAGGQNQNQSVSRNNERLIRYADVLLLLAEAKILSGDVAGGASLINQVRARARDSWEYSYGPQSPDFPLYKEVQKPNNLLPPVPVGSQAQLFKALMHERRVEMGLELARYEDLVRWLRAGLIQPSDIDFWDQVANTNFRANFPNILLRPIPTRELDLNPNLRQNPGF